METDASRECLAGLLSEEAVELRLFEELLEQEHRAIIAKDMEKIDATARSRQDRTGSLARIEAQRRLLCRMHGLSADRPGLETLMGWCDPEGSLVPTLRDCIERAVRCRDLNDRNGTLVSALLKHVERRLAVLRGESDIGVTYGPRPSVAASQGRRVLGSA